MPTTLRSRSARRRDGALAPWSLPGSGGGRRRSRFVRSLLRWGRRWGEQEPLGEEQDHKRSRECQQDTNLQRRFFRFHVKLSRSPFFPFRRLVPVQNGVTANRSLTNRIIAAGMKRATAQQPPGRHPKPSAGTVFPNRLRRVRRAGRVELAERGEHGRNRLLIKPNQCQQEWFHECIVTRSRLAGSPARRPGKSFGPFLPVPRRGPFWPLRAAGE